MRYSSLESVIENSKEAYYLALRQTQATIRGSVPNWQPWLHFFLRSLEQEKRRLAAKIEREKLIIAALPSLSVEIVEYSSNTAAQLWERSSDSPESAAILSKNISRSWSRSSISPGTEQEREAGMSCPSRLAALVSALEPGGQDR